MRLIIASSLFCLTLTLSAQYDSDRHNTSYNSGWISCEQKESPNTVRGMGHWIMYDLQETYGIGQIQVWNLNSPTHLDDGVKTLALDYSIDGISWTSWGEMELPRATASGYYTGDNGPDLEGIGARYLLLTSVESYGGTCAGLSEIKINTSGIVSDVVEIENLPATVIALPSIFSDETIVEISDVVQGKYQYSLTDISGKVIIQQNITLSEGKNQVSVEGSELPEGTYIFTIRDQNRLKSIKIQKIYN